jgi:hypothetical protein
MTSRTFIILPFILGLSLSIVRPAEISKKTVIINLTLPKDPLGRLTVIEETTTINVHVPVASRPSNDPRPAPDVSKLGLQVWLLKADGTIIPQQSADPGAGMIGMGGAENWSVTYRFAKVALAEITGIVFRKEGKLYCQDIAIGAWRPL